MLWFKFQSDSLKIEVFEINPITTFNPVSTKKEGKKLNLLLRKSYNLFKILYFKFQSRSIIIWEFGY